MAEGKFGNTDIEETLEDATRIAIADQIEAGVDLISDGEMGRINFIVGFYSHLTGIEYATATRRMGPPHWDSEQRMFAREKIQAPNGLGIVQDFRLARGLTHHPLKVAVPGPVTLATPIRLGGAYRSQDTLIADLVTIVNRELKSLVEAGATVIQIDEPNYNMLTHGDPQPWIESFNAAVAGVNAEIHLHICFGNLNSKPFAAPRLYRRLFPHIADAKTSRLVLEFASREMAEVGLLKEFACDKELGLGVIDVKAYRAETPEEVAGRIREALKVVPAERLAINPDCGFWDTPRWIARRKLRAMVEGARIVRGELGAQT
jgi:5-methyltetrahydropteroyltriglutamate--homocysteine methyltransferase